MLEVKNISVSYGHVDALHNVNIQVPTGKIVSVIGANGAGKTSLVNTISGLVKPTTGEIVFNGEVLPKASHKIVGKGVVQVPEGRKVFAGLSVQENLIMGSSKLKKPFKEKEAEIYEMFPILGQRKSQQAGTLSGGEQQMLAIGRALMSEPEFIMLDEPSMGLAPVIVKQVFRIIKQINAAGTTILLIEQNARQALGMLTLNPAGAVSVDQVHDLVHGGQVEVKLDGVLQTAGTGGKFQSLLVVEIIQTGIDQSGGEGIAAAYPIHDLHGVLLGKVSLAVGVEHGGPIVHGGGDGLPQSDGHLLKAEGIGQLLRKLGIALQAQLAGGHVGVGGLDAQYLLGILLVGDAHIHIFHQRRHDPLGFLGRPEVLPVV